MATCTNSVTIHPLRFKKDGSGDGCRNKSISRLAPIPPTAAQNHLYQAIIGAQLGITQTDLWGLLGASQPMQNIGMK